MICRVSASVRSRLAAMDGPAPSARCPTRTAKAHTRISLTIVKIWTFIQLAALSSCPNVGGVCTNRTASASAAGGIWVALLPWLSPACHERDETERRGRDPSPGRSHRYRRAGLEGFDQARGGAEDLCRQQSAPGAVPAGSRDLDAPLLRVRRRPGPAARPVHHSQAR